MAVTHVEFHPVIVANPSMATADSPSEQFPDGTGPDALRIVRARDVRPGDWYLGACQQDSSSRSRLSYGVYSSTGFAARPRLRRWRKKVAIDGTHFHLRADDLVMIVPGSLIPFEDWMGESFIWEAGDLRRF
ncbi:hypothetical protein ACFV9E_35240 [Streptomyces sp. NPDC059835]|uniref:hypothetical protein n=1 Tax=Streptomyces sp. NPDC059835 TaxID=3346967 RepID=UPI00366218FD